MPADGSISSESRVPRGQSFRNTETRTNARNLLGLRLLHKSNKKIIMRAMKNLLLHNQQSIDPYRIPL